ncbi:hypothetical protein BD311DRAFT_758892 [Dichomitus squalens]|uniref:Uncharacterized protein n=1 Tax=Dichomitus squalens TaxID=114155 RepID=A0A4Q9MPU5_9APHY|nr:hypothetical protein BD311DRAFT_758892 [Dichomitus squalens]
MSTQQYLRRRARHMHGTSMRRNGRYQWYVGSLLRRASGSSEMFLPTAGGSSRAFRAKSICQTGSQTTGNRTSLSERLRADTAKGDGRSIMSMVGMYDARAGKM